MKPPPSSSPRGHSHILSAATLLGALLLSLETQGQSLAEAAKIVAGREPELRAAGHDSNAAFHQWQTTRSERKPHIYIDGSSGLSARNRSVDGLETSNGDPLFQRDIGLSVRQLLFDGGVAKNASRQAHAEWNVQQYLERGMVEERIVDLAEVYLELFRAREQISSANQNISAHNTILSKLRATEEMGNKAEIALVQGRIGAAKRELELQKWALKQAENRFKRLVGHHPKNISMPKIPSLPGSKKATDLSNNFDYLAAAEGVKVSERRLTSLNGYNKPKVYADAGYGLGYDTAGIRGNDNETRALLTFNWDLHKGGQNKEMKRREISRIAKAQQLAQAADEQRQYRNSLLWDERSNAIEVGMALYEYKSKISTAADDYEDQFRQLGTQSLLSILDLQSEEFRAGSQLIDSRFERDTSVYRILGNQGRLSEYFGIRFDDSIHEESIDDLPIGERIGTAVASDIEASEIIAPSAEATPRKRIFKFKKRTDPPRKKPFGGIFRK